MSKLGAFIKLARIQLNMTQEDLALAFNDDGGMEVSLISKWERGTHIPSMRNFEELIAILQLDRARAMQLRVEALKKVSDARGNGKYYKYVTENRHRLQDYILESNYYRSVIEPNLFGFPLITKDDWLAPMPIPIESIKIELETSSPKVSMPTFSKRIPRFSDFKLRRGEDVRDNYCYRLLAVDASGSEVSMTFGPSSYWLYVDQLEYLGFELALWKIQHQGLYPKNDGSDLAARGPAQDIWDVENRMNVTGVNTLLIIKNDPNHEDHFLIHNRNSPSLSEARNTRHVMPAGTFQPDNLAYKDDKCFSLKRNVLRELMEELYGVEEVKHLIRSNSDFTDSEKVAPFYAAMEDGRIPVHYLGLGFDPLTTKPEILTVVVLDCSKVRFGSSVYQTPNWEGQVERIPLSKENLIKYGQHVSSMLPAGAACCLRGSKFYEQIMQ